MTRARVIAVGVSILIMATNVFAGDMTPSEIIAEVNATYESMQTYRAEGTVVTDIDNSAKAETSFSILLKKPNLYRISWTQKNMPPGANGVVWSDGSQPYLYTGDEYFKMSSDKIALAAATGVSLQVAYIVPSLFLSAFKQKPTVLSKLSDPKLEKSEPVGDEDCYVLSATTEGTKKTFWISKSKYLIVKYAFTVDHSAGGLPTIKLTDAQIDEAIQQMGEKPTDENRKKVREMMQATNDNIKKFPAMKGFSLTTYVNISSPDLRKEDFQFVPPKGTVMKDSMLSTVSGEAK